MARKGIAEVAEVSRMAAELGITDEQAQPIADAAAAQAAGAEGPATGRQLIKFGSADHAALLGLDDPHLTAERRKELEEALHTRPAVSVNPRRKRPVLGGYRPTTRNRIGEPIIDGWTVMGRG